MAMIRAITAVLERQHVSTQEATTTPPPAESKQLTMNLPVVQSLTMNSYGMMLEARCQQLDMFCHRLEGLVAQLVGVIESLPKDKIPSPHGTADEELQQAAQALQSLPGPRDVAPAVVGAHLEVDTPSEAECILSPALDADTHDPVPLSVDEEIEDELSESNGQNTSDDPTVGRFGSLVTDSYGALR